MPRKSDSSIGFILKAFPRLSETFILNEILLLEKSGVKLHIFAMRRPNEDVVHDSVRKIKARVTYIPDYPWRFFLPLVIANVRQWWHQPQSYVDGLRCAVRHSLRTRTSSTFKRFVQAAYLTQHMPQNTNISHFHSHFSNDPTTVALFASKLTGISYSVSAHAKDVYVQDQHLLREKVAQARFVVTCTERNRTYLQRYCRNGVAILRAYHGVNLDFFSSSKSVKPETPPLIFSVGRLVPKKGFDVLIEALSLLREKGTNFQCTIIGDGPTKAELEAQISRLNLASHIAILPSVSQTEIVQYYRKASLFALACQVLENGDRDGIPNVIVEAMAMKLPIVSTTVSGIPECVDDGVNGLLVNERDPRAFAEAIAKLLEQPVLCRKLGEAARQQVEKHFNAAKNIDVIASALREVVAGNESRRSLPVQEPPPYCATATSRAGTLNL